MQYTAISTLKVSLAAILEGQWSEYFANQASSQ